MCAGLHLKTGALYFPKLTCKSIIIGILSTKMNNTILQGFFPQFNVSVTRINLDLYNLDHFLKSDKNVVIKKLPCTEYPYFSNTHSYQTDDLT